MASKPELYVAVDIEADGPIPGEYSMLSLGMAVAGRDDLTFYTELKPISDRFVPEALKVCGLDRELLKKTAPAPEDAMQAAANFVEMLRKEGRPIFLAAPAVWDGMYVHWYFTRFIGHNPFGVTGSGIDLRSYWMGRTGCEWTDTHKSRIKEKLKVEGHPHTHNALDDARELAAVFDAVLRAAGSGAGGPPGGA